jgi:hypothetical protein
MHKDFRINTEYVIHTNELEHDPSAVNLAASIPEQMRLLQT